MDRLRARYLAVVLVMCLTAGVRAQPAATAPATSEPAGSATSTPAHDDGPAYKVSRFELSYVAENPQNLPVARIEQAPVELSQSDTGYVAPQPGLPTVRRPLKDYGGGQTFHASAIRAIAEQLVLYFHSQGRLAVSVFANGEDLDLNTAEDLRPADRTALRMTLRTGVVKELRTLATNDRVREADKINNPRHERIRENSPVKPNGFPGPPGTDLVRQDLIDDYVFALNRLPGRRVDVAISGSGEPGGIDLDYLVHENRPVQVYAQLSNTGTKSTNPWRERIGLIDNQLTNHDDILTLDYSTGGFSDSSNAVIASYERPISDWKRGLRVKVFGLINQYNASELGIIDERFSGEEYNAGAELVGNLYHHRELFVDAAAGFRYSHYDGRNHVADLSGHGDFFQPYLGLRFDKAGDRASTDGSVNLVFGTSGSSKRSLSGLGRVNPDPNFTELQFDVSHAFFLEPLFNPRGFRDRASSQTLAHEMYFSLHGQYDFGGRLVPQQEQTVGGFGTVRGYPEAFTTGDSIYVATAEYRFHVPRALAVQEDPGKTPVFGRPFKRSPQYTFGRPDWDLIFRGFVDAGFTQEYHRTTFEHNDTLVSTGVGVEFQVKNNINLRVDWGIALNGIDDRVQAGSNRFHVVLTFLY